MNKTKTTTPPAPAAGSAVREWLQEKLWLYEAWSRHGPACRGWSPTDGEKRAKFEAVRDWLKATLDAPKAEVMEAVCPRCWNFRGGHACGSFDICCCHSPNTERSGGGQ